MTKQVGLMTKRVGDPMETGVEHQATHYARCVCMGEGVAISFWDGSFGDFPDVILTVWHDASMGAAKWPWKTRLRAILDIIRRGHVGYEYGVILDRTECDKLHAWLGGLPWPNDTGQADQAASPGGG